MLGPHITLHLHRRLVGMFQQICGHPSGGCVSLRALISRAVASWLSKPNRRSRRRAAASGESGRRRSSTAPPAMQSIATAIKFMIPICQLVSMRSPSPITIRDNPTHAERRRIRIARRVQRSWASRSRRLWMGLRSIVDIVPLWRRHTFAGIGAVAHVLVRRYLCSIASATGSVKPSWAMGLFCLYAAPQHEVLAAKHAEFGHACLPVLFG